MGLYSNSQAVVSYLTLSQVYSPLPFPVAETTEPGVFSAFSVTTDAMDLVVEGDATVTCPALRGLRKNGGIAQNLVGSLEMGKMMRNHGYGPQAEALQL